MFNFYRSTVRSVAVCVLEDLPGGNVAGKSWGNSQNKAKERGDIREEWRVRSSGTSKWEKGGVSQQKGELGGE